MKENKQPILSICIPTWNRRYALQHTLKSIIDQDEFKSWNVEIVISDNASTDETEVEVWKLRKKYKNIRYFRNKENIWGNPNINKALSLREGVYLWLLGSDSLITNWWI
jgi:glycosyltransferase involved in cell wall biosynthesis